MELNERETLVKVEQQLKNVIENQTQISEDQRGIFNKIEQESKTLAAVKGDLKAHLETSTVQRQNCSEQINSTKKESIRIESSLKEEVLILKDRYEEERTLREALEKELAVFKQTIQHSFRIFKWTIGVIGVIMSILTPYITLLINGWIKK